MRGWIVLALAAFVFACSPQTAVTKTPVVEEPMAEPFVEPTGTPRE
jgi:hypothetical protein